MFNRLVRGNINLSRCSGLVHHKTAWLSSELNLTVGNVFNGFLTFLTVFLKGSKKLYGLLWTKIKLKTLILIWIINF